MLNIYLFQLLFWFLNFGFYLFCKLKSALVVNGFFDTILRSKLLRLITRGCTQKMSLTIPNLNCVVLKLRRFKERWNRCEIWNWWKRWWEDNFWRADYQEVALFIRNSVFKWWRRKFTKKLHSARFKEWVKWSTPCDSHCMRQLYYTP